MIEYRVIRGPQDADIKALAAISALSNEDPHSLQAQMEYFAGELERLDFTERVLVGAYAGAELVGFCRFVLSPTARSWWCRGLEVVPPWRRQGVGTRLLVTALNHLRIAGAKTVLSDASNTNDAAKATHVKAGFRMVGTADKDFDGNWRDNHCFYRWDAE